MCKLVFSTLLVVLCYTGSQEVSSPKTPIQNKKVVCYYTAWSHSIKSPYGFNPDQIDPFLCTHLIYAFADIGQSNHLISADPEFDLEQRAYANIVELKHINPNLKVMLSIGGWEAGSRGFVQISSTETNRTEFANNVVRFLRVYRFDGLDLRWEYPNFREGGSPRDRENYVLLAQALRTEFDRDSGSKGRERLLLSIAITHKKQYLPYFDLAKFNLYMDFISVLTYEYHQPTEPVVNHPTPLYSVANLSGNKEDDELNVNFTINYFAKYVDRDKMVMAIPLYGRTYKLHSPGATALGSESDGAGDEWPITNSKGISPYFEICMQLKTDNWTIVQPKPGAVGPYAYKGDQWVGYDDIQMVKNKAAYAVQQGLGGVAFWTVGYDDFLGSCHGTKFPMVKAARNELSRAQTECLLPEDPGNRLFCPYQCTECSLNPYSSCTYPSRTQSVQAIKVQCLPGYGLDTGQDQTMSVVCFNHTWIPSLPECQEVCPPLESEFLDITCFNEFTEVDCRKHMRVGIRATYKCKPSHKEFSNLASVGIYKRTLVCKNGGHWTNSLPECDPICGLSSGNDSLTPNIVNGTATKLGQFPWHTALYKRNSLNNEVWDNICGGSLITHRVVLSAAHCVAGVITKPADLRVALGKYFRDWAKDENDTIWRDLVSIKLPPEYKGGATSYTWDIALLLMNASVQFNSFVMPVCMNLESHNHLTNGDIGYVVGWGRTSPEGEESEVLLFNTVTILAEDYCQRIIALFLSFDKFCGTKSGVSVVQPGDSGGGLTAIVGGLHYIFGVVSTKSKEVPMFTNISWYTHKGWIDREIINIIN